MNADELVEHWAIEEYKNKYRDYNNTNYFHKYNHLIQCSFIKATPISFGWECWCYSDYTRDDGFRTSFTISCDCGVEDAFTMSNGDWNLPDIIKQLEEYENTQECPYWDE